MRKYLSCIILIVLCVLCATIFYVKAIAFGDEVDSPPSANSSSSADTEDTQKPPVVTINKSGTILSEYLSTTNLRIEWSLYKLENESSLYVSADLHLDTPEQITKSCKGYLTVNGEKREFTTKTMVGTTNQLTSYSGIFQMQSEANIEIEAYIDTVCYTTSNDRLDGISAKGTIVASEEYVNMPSSHQILLNHISKFPELPSGDEITSLCMVLNYLQYNIDKCELSDLYLDKGPADYTDIFVANAGNPKDTYNSFGCMPSVIVNAANKFIEINGGKAYATDISGVNVDMLYYEVSRGNPIIVWACEEFDTTPSVFRTVIINGKTIYLKSNINTLVLIGYDFENKTVSLADPSGTVFDLDIDLFEQRYAQAGSYAVLIK